MKKHFDPKDNTVTHFTASKNKSNDGFFITLYRFRSRPFDKDEKLRPQYKGPLGWHFHSSVNDEDVIPKLKPIEELPEVTGDNLIKGIFNKNSMYAG